MFNHHVDQNKLSTRPNIWVHNDTQKTSSSERLLCPLGLQKRPQCPECQKVFARKKAMLRHLKEIYKKIVNGDRAPDCDNGDLHVQRKITVRSLEDFEI